MLVRYAFFLMMLVPLPPIFFCGRDSLERKSLFKSKSTSKGVENEKDLVAKRNRIDDVRYFEDISENPPAGPYTTSVKPDLSMRHRHSKERSLVEIKALLAKLLEKIDELDIDMSTDYSEKFYPSDNRKQFPEYRNMGYTMPKYSEQTTISTASPKLSLIQRIERRRRKKERKEEKRQRWGKWTNWSPCSVSCGKGREIRWRHCLENCDVAETEMEEKTCQLPACPPNKLFGVIKL